jgi:hypothetical protein
MTKILLAVLTLAMMTSAAPAQSRTFYDASGKVVGRSSTDSAGTVTNLRTTIAVAGLSAASSPAATRRPSMMRAVAFWADDDDDQSA